MAISDRRALGRPLDDWVRGLDGLVDAVQVREKDLAGRELFELARRLRQVARQTAVLVNGRTDVALASGCAGVHLTSSGLPIAAVCRRFGDALLIGCSTHRPEEVEEARRAGADYAVFGPVFPTPSKAPYGPPPGVAGLRRAAACGLPVIAIGGIGPERMAEVAEAGAAGVAGIRAFFDPTTVEEMAAESRRLWSRAESPKMLVPSPLGGEG